MNTQERQKRAEEYGLTADIGKKVKATFRHSFRCGDVAEIVGWGVRPKQNGFLDNRPLYFIKYENGECSTVFAGRLFKESGFIFVE